MTDPTPTTAPDHGVHVQVQAHVDRDLRAKTSLTIDAVPTPLTIEQVRQVADRLHHAADIAERLERGIADEAVERPVPVR